MIDPRKTPAPTERTCSGPCCRLLPLTEANYRLDKRPGRYPWQPSAWAKNCRACAAQALRDLRESRASEVRKARNDRRRATRAAVKHSQGMPAAQMRALTATQAAKRKTKAQAKALIKRTLLRPYSPERDGIKQRIKRDTEAAMRKHLAKSPRLTQAAQAEPRDTQDHRAALEALRARHRAESGNT
jgi:hypothetical protein